VSSLKEIWLAPIVATLLELPRELCPRAGEVLRNLTGQDFGPGEGDTLVEIYRIVGKWQEWLKENDG